MLTALGLLVAIGVAALGGSRAPLAQDAGHRAVAPQIANQASGPAPTYAIPTPSPTATATRSATSTPTSPPTATPTLPPLPTPTATPLPYGLSCLAFTMDAEYFVCVQPATVPARDIFDIVVVARTQSSLNKVFQLKITAPGEQQAGVAQARLPYVIGEEHRFQYGKDFMKLYASFPAGVYDIELWSNNTPRLSLYFNSPGGP